MSHEEEIMESVTKVFKDVFANDAIVLRPEMTANDIEGWDSIHHLMIIVGVEKRFGIRLRTREVDGLKCVGDIIRLVGAKRSAS